MSVKGRIRKMFPGGNTTIGPYFRFDDMVRPATNRIFIIKGGPGTGKSTFMNSIGRELLNKGYDIEHFHCATDPDSLDGLVIPDLGVALLDGTAPHVFDPRCPGARDEIINLGECWEEDLLNPHKDEILEINKRGSMYFQTAFHLLRQSKLAYDQCRWYVEESVDRGKYNRILRMLTESVLEGLVPNYQATPTARHLFASALTPKGILDFKDTLISKDKKVISIKGLPGTGVKEMIGGIARAVEEIGLYTEQYHCPFEPDKLDLLIIPAAAIAVINSTGPDHFEPESLNDPAHLEEIDLGLCIRQELLSDYEEEWMEAEKRWRGLLDKGLTNVAKAKAVHGENEKFFVRAMNYDRVNEIRDQTLRRILEFA